MCFLSKFSRLVAMASFLGEIISSAQWREGATVPTQNTVVKSSKYFIQPMRIGTIPPTQYWHPCAVPIAPTWVYVHLWQSSVSKDLFFPYADTCVTVSQLTSYCDRVGLHYQASRLGWRCTVLANLWVENVAWRSINCSSFWTRSGIGRCNAMLRWRFWTAHSNHERTTLLGVQITMHIKRVSVEISNDFPLFFLRTWNCKPEYFDRASQHRQ